MKIKDIGSYKLKFKKKMKVKNNNCKKKQTN